MATPAVKNRRMVGVGRDLCGSPSPTPCPSRVTQSRLHRTSPRRVLNISREGDSTAPLSSLGQCITKPAPGHYKDGSERIHQARDEERKGNSKSRNLLHFPTYSYSYVPTLLLQRTTGTVA